MSDEKKPKKSRHGGVRPNSGRKKGSTNTPRQKFREMFESQINDIEIAAFIRECWDSPDMDMKTWIFEHYFGRAKQAIDADISGGLDITITRKVIKKP